jgi:hypothetical protein
MIPTPLECELLLTLSYLGKLLVSFFELGQFWSNFDDSTSSKLVYYHLRKFFALWFVSIGQIFIKLQMIKALDCYQLVSKNKVQFLSIFDRSVCDDV